jgi:hypothetical protein
MADQNIEKKLMKLDVNSRAKLASKLLTSLEDLSEDEIEKLWAEEAFRRDEELNKGKAKLIDAGIVFKSARARFK